VHWTRIQALRDQIVEQQQKAGVRVIKVPHALGFLDSHIFHPLIDERIIAKCSPSRLPSIQKD